MRVVEVAVSLGSDLETFRRMGELLEQPHQARSILVDAVFGWLDVVGLRAPRLVVPHAQTPQGGLVFVSWSAAPGWLALAWSFNAPSLTVWVEVWSAAQGRTAHVAAETVEGALRALLALPGAGGLPVASRGRPCAG